jgi:hypothetical protein
MIRISIFLIALAGLVALAATVPLHSLEWGSAEPVDEPVAVLPVSNEAGKSNKANAGLDILDGYIIVQTETAPITTAVAAAARAAMEMPLSPPPPPPEEPTNILLNEAQLVSLRERLRLTAEQAQYWPAVETALRAFVRSQYEANRIRPNGTPTIDQGSPELQDLYAAAVPFFATLDDRQKQQIRLLAGMIGLEGVISQL